MLVLTLVRQLIDFYVEKTSVRTISIEELSPQMNLSEASLSTIKADKDYNNLGLATIYSEGLDKEQVERIKEWFKKKKKQRLDSIEIYQPFPFVIWMFLGVILTLVLKGSLVHLILSYL